MKEKAVVCLSGGMDSITSLAFAALKYDIILMHVNYGQLTEGKELNSFNSIASWYDIPLKHRYVFYTDVLKKVGESCLTSDSIEVPQEGIDSNNIPVSYVPFRNGNILAAAASLAQAIRAHYIYTGFVEEDSSGYPDCREEFADAFQAAIKEGLRPEANVKVISPLLHMTKTEIVKNAITLKVPMHLTWSCYKNQDVACGLCDSCRLRIKGFSEMGIIDPIEYAIQIAWPKNCKPYDYVYKKN